MKVQLSDGSQVNIRFLEPGDVDRLYEFFLKNIKEEDLLLFKDNVRDYYLVKSWCENIDHQKVIPVVAEAEDGRIIGVGSLHRRSYGWARQVGKIRVSICAWCRGRGLGRAIMERLIEIAREKGIKVIIAEVLSAQESALQTLRKSPFEEQAVIKEISRDHRGNPLDLHIFVLYL